MSPVPGWEGKGLVTLGDSYCSGMAVCLAHVSFFFFGGGAPVLLPGPRMLMLRLLEPSPM